MARKRYPKLDLEFTVSVLGQKPGEEEDASVYLATPAPFYRVSWSAGLVFKRYHHNTAGELYLAGGYKVTAVSVKYHNHKPPRMEYRVYWAPNGKSTGRPIADGEIRMEIIQIARQIERLTRWRRAPIEITPARARSPRGTRAGLKKMIREVVPTDPWSPKKGKPK
jgi:hypothetical protein